MRPVTGIASARRDNLALFQERIADGYSLGQQAARIVAKIKHDAFQRIAFGLEEVINRFHQAGCGLLGKGGDTHIADAIEDFRPHRSDFDEVAHNGHVERLGLAALDLDLDL